MFILNYIKSRTKRRAENKRIAIDARTFKEQVIANQHTGYSLSQIVDLIKHAEKELSNLPLPARLFTRKQYQIRIAGLHRARNLISARYKASENYKKMRTIANAPTVVIQKKKAA